MTYMRFSVCCRRSVIECVRTRTLPKFYTLLEYSVLLPKVKNLNLSVHKIHRSIDFLVHKLLLIKISFRPSRDERRKHSAVPPVLVKLTHSMCTSMHSLCNVRTRRWLLFGSPQRSWVMTLHTPYRLAPHAARSKQICNIVSQSLL